MPRSIWSQEANAPWHFGDEKNVTPPLILGLVEAMFKRHLWCRCWRTRAWRRTRQDGTHGWLEMPFLQDFRRWQLVLGQNFWYHSPHHIFGGWTSICQPFFLMFTKVPEFSCVARWTYHAHQPASDLWFLCIDAVSYLDMDDMVTQRCYTGVQSWADILNHLEKLSCPLNYR